MRSPIQSIVLTAGLFVGLLCLFVLPVPTVFAQDDQPPQRKITVSGEAQINVVPDEVVITLGVETSDKSMSTAKRQNDSHVASLSAVARGFGIAPEQIRTNYLSVGSRYYANNPITVRRTIAISLKDISKFDDLLNVILDLQGINLLGIQFRTSELPKYKDQARSLAIKAARHKAEAMAGDLGQKLGKPITITEDRVSWSSYYDYYGYWWGYGGYGSQYGSAGGGPNAVQNAPAPASGNAPSGSDDTLAPGQINVNARVTVTFELAD